MQAFQRMDQPEDKVSGVENTAVEIAKRWAEQLQTQIKDTGNYVIAPNVWNVFESRNPILLYMSLKSRFNY